MEKKKIGLSFLVLTLVLLVVLSFVAITHLILRTGKQSPFTNIDISVSDSDNHDNRNKKENKKKQNNGNVVSESVYSGEPEIYHNEIQVFCAEYGKDGKISVKSALGDKVVAPGTENQYDLFVRNVGKVPVSYVLEAQTSLTVHVDGNQIRIPIEASFTTPNGNFLLGDGEHFEHLAELDGMTDGSDLAPKHQAKYTLRWSWPFDVDDEFDTLLGNLAAEGEELTVKVSFHITASCDPSASGGVPITGDTAETGLWVTLCIVSTFTLLILLFWGKREKDEEKK